MAPKPLHDRLAEETDGRVTILQFLQSLGGGDFIGLGPGQALLGAAADQAGRTPLRDVYPVKRGEELKAPALVKTGRIRRRRRFVMAERPVLRLEPGLKARVRKIRRRLKT